MGFLKADLELSGQGGEDDSMAIPLYSRDGQRRVARYRRLLILFLFLVTSLMVVRELKRGFFEQRGGYWEGKRVSLSKSPIRGSSKSLKALGEPCSVDEKAVPNRNAAQHRIHSKHAIVFDAGSTGSRVHVYEFQFCGPRLASLVDETFVQVNPGLGSYHEEPLKAADSLQPLVVSVESRIPSDLQPCTPVMLKATAGLRLLPSEKVANILSGVERLLREKSFDVSGTEAVSVMDGAEEAVYAWLTVNYLSEKIALHLPKSSFKPEDSAIVLDLGGASTQIVFALPTHFRYDKEKLGRFYYQLGLHGHQITLYQHSYLGYGLGEAKKAIKNAFLASRSSGKEFFPCLPQAYSEEFTTTAGKQTKLVGSVDSSWDSCLSAVKPIFRVDDLCIAGSCSFNGVHQPPFISKTIVAFSYFYDRLSLLGISDYPTLWEVAREGRTLCKAQPDGKYAGAISENPSLCLEVAYIYSLLRVGYRIDASQPIHITKQVNGYEASWSLGVALKMLDNPKTLSCPAEPK